MRQSILKLAAVAAIGILCTTSCSKEVLQPQKEYPSEVTAENCLEFLDAPKEVWAKVAAKYHAEHPEPKAVSSLSAEDNQKNPCAGNPNFKCGQVFAWNNGAWSGIPGVFIREVQTGIMTNSILFGNYVITSPAVSTLCMSYNTPLLNGVTTADIVAIQSHILGTTLFDSALPESNAVRMYMAADANFDGVINVLDLVKIQRAILYDEPFDQNVTITAAPEMELYVAQVALQYLHGSCYSSSLNDRRLVKIGDVNGNFVF